MSAHGFGRLVEFFHDFMDAIHEETAGRDIIPQPKLYPHMRIEDLWLALISGSFFLVARLILRVWIIPSVCRKYDKTLQAKLSENLYYTLYYISSTIFFSFVAEQESWVWDVFTLPRGAGDRRCLLALFQDLPPDYSSISHMYYMISLGFYLSAVIFLIGLDTRRSDFVELVLHHVITLGLIVLSYTYGYLHCGIAIFSLHDVGDIFLYLAKSIHYLGLAGLDTAIFAVFAVTFYTTRLVILPRITYVICVESLRELAYNPKFNQWAHNFEFNLTHLSMFSVLLSGLIVLHCFWFGLILKMIHREVFLGEKISEKGDIREEE